MQSVGDLFRRREAGSCALSAAENKNSVDRLAEMLYWNTKEALGEDSAERALALKNTALDAEVELAYGDGHLAPHEWIRASNGTIWKVDAEGHSSDHTLVGEQSVLWDVAGACVEWDLNPGTSIPLLEAIEARGIRVNPEPLSFYLAAYSAFRAGLVSLGIAQISDAQEKSCIH